MDYQLILAKCYVDLAEVNYDIREWGKTLERMKAKYAAIPQEVRSGTVSN